MPDAPRAARRPTLAALERRDEFASRHIGPDDEDQRAMLATLGFASRGAMIDAIVPAAIRNRAPLALPGPVPEYEALVNDYMKTEKPPLIALCQYDRIRFTPDLIRSTLETHGAAVLS